MLTDNGVTGHKTLQEELVVMRSLLKQCMDRGLPVDQMTVARALQQAVDAASRAVDKLYEKL